MKKNKKVQYLLIGLVVLIWGTIAWQFVQMKNGNGTDFSVDTYNPALAQTEVLGQDSFSLNLNYSDPFSMQKVFVKNRTTSPTATRRNIPKLKNKRKVKRLPLPEVTYNGFATNKNNQITKVQIRIVDKLYTLKVHDQIDKLRLKQIFRDSIVLEWQGKEHLVKRKK